MGGKRLSYLLEVGWLLSNLTLPTCLATFSPCLRYPFQWLQKLRDCKAIFYDQGLRKVKEIILLVGM